MNKLVFDMSFWDNPQTRTGHLGIKPVTKILSVTELVLGHTYKYLDHISTEEFEKKRLELQSVFRDPGALYDKNGKCIFMAGGFIEVTYIPTVDLKGFPNSSDVIRYQYFLSPIIPTTEAEINACLESYGPREDGEDDFPGMEEEEILSEIRSEFESELLSAKGQVEALENLGFLNHGVAIQHNQTNILEAGPEVVCSYYSKDSISLPLIEKEVENENVVWKQFKKVLPQQLPNGNNDNLNTITADAINMKNNYVVIQRAIQDNIPYRGYFISGPSITNQGITMVEPENQSSYTPLNDAPTVAFLKDHYDSLSQEVKDLFE